MKTHWTALVVSCWLVAGSVLAEESNKTPASSSPQPAVRVAVFQLEADDGSPLPAEALTDRVIVACSMLPNVTLVDRAEMERVADEQKMSLSGITDPAAGVRLGHMLAATHVIVGRLSTIGQSYYLILKVVDVETTAQKVVSTKAPVTDDVEALFADIEERLAAALGAAAPQSDGGDQAAKLAESAAWLRGKTVIIDVSETHVSRPLADPACSTALFNQLKKLGVKAILPNAPAEGWKDALRATGEYLDAKVDYLLEGEGTSSFAAEIQGMTSCRARVELRLVPVPGREVKFVETGVGAKADLVEDLAAKAALEEASQGALKRLLEAGAKPVAADEGA